MPATSPNDEDYESEEEVYDPSTAPEDELLRDIEKASAQPTKLYTIVHRQHPRVLKAAVRARPPILENLSSRVGLTPEVVDELMEENIDWFKLLPVSVKTREVCLNALRDSDKLLSYIPNHIKNDPEDPIFYEMAIDHNAANITKVPPAMLTEALMTRAFTKSPNILHLESMSFALRDRFRDYEDAPIPPSLQRQMSNTHTDQGADGVCGRHAFSRVIVKNFFELILPLQYTDKYREKECNEFLSTTYLVNDRPDAKLHQLTPQLCSFSGYIKILLFLHCFFLFQKHIPTVADKPEGWLECVQVSALYKHLYTSIEIPRLTSDQRYDLKDALHTLQRLQTKHSISLVTFHFKDITIENIRNITDHGLYIMLRIEDSKNTEGLHAAHFVIIVGAFDDYMLVKNSWDSDAIYKIKFGYPFYLGSHVYDVLTDCSFVIPVQQPRNEEFGNLTHVNAYLTQYDELKTKFNSVVVNVVNKSCPSRNKTPVECDRDHPFRQQANVFHPDKNPRCREDAELKFKELVSLRGCRHDSPGKSVRLLGYMRKSKKGKRTVSKRSKKPKSKRKN